VACHVPSYLGKYDMLKGLKKGGTFLLNSLWDAEETKKRLPDDVKKYLAENRINLYIINATKIAAEIGLGNRTNTIMQAAFFRIANVIPYDIAVEQMKKFIVKSFGTKGEEIVNMNFSAIDRGGEPERVDVPEEWATIKLQEGNHRRELPEFIRNVVEPINSLKGDDLPVSAFLGREDGTFPAGTTAYEKRGIAVEVPEWIASNCIQCNQCAYVCPHASIRPFLLNEEEMKILPEGTATLKAIPKTFDGLQFRIQISPLDCTGCGNCVDVCPAKSKALVFKPLDEKQHDIKLWELISEKVSYKDSIVQKDKSVKNSQFAQPLFEFSGACAGCGETPYIKLITQLYGDRMIIANATGCSSIFGGSAPSTSYTVNAKGHGPAWANSLFEDNAEFGYGLALGVNKLRERISLRMQALIQDHILPETKTALVEWIEAMHDSEKSPQASEKVIAHLQNENNQMAQEILSLKQYLVKKSIWVFGGDGWAYDIGFGGLDHVIASGDDINLLVLDTEVYSNTGGQSSKATPIGAVAKFASIGKRIRKKDLSMMAMSYGYVYVAQIAMGANQAQTLRAIREAENYKGPSLIIAYSPCIAHGIIAGMGMTQREADLAVKCGYWVNFRYNPMLEAEGKNPLEIDSKEPDWSKFKDFLDGEIRYAALKKAFPKEAAEMIKAAEDNARWRYNAYKRLSAMY
ncbi:MAG TPA: pyruvate:ferredoxin (flavodoxin) oxidoreductase, partial [Bacteroidales bacterium]|nr:pyruvate:ferredoxin (flavodoxin) oxidoreductase [Bacteroidales bacterium]